jgi:hypothetical protein
MLTKKGRKKEKEKKRKRKNKSEANTLIVSHPPTELG